MPRNASGVYTLPAGNPVITNTTITSTWANATMSDLGSEITNSLDRAGRGGMTGALKLSDGTEALPGLSFTSELSSGLRRVSAGVLAFSILGTEAARLTATGFVLPSTSVIPNPLGVVGAPSYTFTGDTDTGMWSPAADTIAWSLAGAEALRLDSNGLTLASGRFLAPNGTAALPGYGFATDADSGIYLIANNRVGVSIGSSNPVEFAATGLGIHTTPSYQLHVTTPAAATARAVIAAAAGQASVLGLAGNGTTVGVSAFDLQMDSTGNVDIVQRSNARMSFYTNDTERLRITNDGRLYGTALHNNAGSVTGTATQYIASGTYTPTLTNIANVDTSTAYVTQWMRVGNVVTVSGRISVDPTAAGATVVNVSLPIASTLATLETCCGTLVVNDAVGFLPGMIYADTANNVAGLRANPSTTAVGSNWFFTFTYLIS